MYFAVIEHKQSHKFYIQKFAVRDFFGSTTVTSLATTYVSQVEAPAELGQIIDGTSKE